MSTDGNQEEFAPHHEEVWNALTHGIGLALSVAGFVVLAVRAAWYGGATEVIGCLVYGTTLVTMYAASTLYHSARAPGAKRALKLFDHCAIYLLIAGSYTPFTVIVLRGGWGWTLLGLVWTIGLLGILQRVLLGHRFKSASLASYLLMGWLAVIAVKPMMAAAPGDVLAWIVAGGLAYTAGTVFYGLPVVRYNHAVWHLFVLVGSFCHYVAVSLCIGPVT